MADPDGAASSTGSASQAGGPKAIARSYYAAIDAGDYEGLADLLDPGFVHERPDRTLDGRDAFVGFMREDRPRTDTVHRVDGVYDGPDGVAVTGRLLADGTDDLLLRFVDVFTIEDGSIEGLRTFADGDG